MGNAFAFRNPGWFCVLSRERPQIPAPPICLLARGWRICKEALVFLPDFSIPFPVQLQGCFTAWVEGPRTGIQKPWVTGDRLSPTGLLQAGVRLLYGLVGCRGKPLGRAILIP